MKWILLVIKGVWTGKIREELVENPQQESIENPTTEKCGDLSRNPCLIPGEARENWSALLSGAINIEFVRSIPIVAS
jgi:hypothetical protein